MASNYPNSLDALTNPVSTDPLNNPAHAEQHEDANDAIEAVQATLGTNPEGGYATVDARLTDIASQASSASVFADAAAVSASIAQGAEVDASNAANLAEDWAIQLVDPVSGGEYSSKFHAQAAATSASAAASSATSAASSASSVDATATTATELRQFGADGSILQNLPTRVHPGEQLLKQAVWWIDAAHSSAGDQSIKNLGWGGSVLDAQSGSTAAADSNDPLFLAWEGENYVYLPGVSGNYLSVPDEAALDITGDIDIRVQVALDDWTPSTTQRVLSKLASSNVSYELNVDTAGNITINYSADGTTVFSGNSVLGTGFTDGSSGWIRVVIDVDNGASGHDVKFYTSLDGSLWTQLGATVTTAGTISLFSGNAAVGIGSRTGGTTGNCTGKFYRAQILDGIDGTPVLDVDTSLVESGSDTSFTALTGQTVTINRSSSGRKSVAVTHPVWLFGTDDYMEVADNDLIDFGASDSFTVLAVTRQWDAQSGARFLIRKFPAAYGVIADSASVLQYGLTISDGTNTATSLATSTAGTLNVSGGFVDRSVEEIVRFIGGSISASLDTSSVGSLSSSGKLFIGQRGDSIYTDFEFVAAAIFRKALTAGEIATLNSYFQGRAA